MKLTERAYKIVRLLDEHYPENTECYLDYDEPYQLLIATILSAQCTDDRVNLVTKDLFKQFPSIEAFANADLSELERGIKSTGFFHNKAKHIKHAMERILIVYGGQLPIEINDLLSLAGVGRKTANVIRAHIYNEPAIIVDTHVGRISNRLGLTDKKDPVKIEFELMDIMEREYWSQYNTQSIAFGRKICKARNPKCGECFLINICKR